MRDFNKQHPSIPPPLFRLDKPRLKNEKKKSSKLHNLEVKHQACRFGPWKIEPPLTLVNHPYFFHPAILVPSVAVFVSENVKNGYKSATFFHIKQISPHLQKASSSAAHHLPSSRCHRWSCTKKGTISSGWHLWPSNATALLLNLMEISTHWLGKKQNGKRLGKSVEIRSLNLYKGRLGLHGFCMLENNTPLKTEQRG